MNRVEFAFLGVAFCGLLSLASGCGKASDAPTVAKVKGTVTYNGKPLPQGTIVFHPPKGRPASGRIENGEILDVTTVNPGDGAPVGLNKVAIQSVEADPQDESGMTVKSLIPDKYTASDQSGLTANIEEGKVNELTLSLQD